MASRNVQHAAIATICFFLCFSPSSSSNSALGVLDVHDLLPKYGLPKGLLPKDINSYSLSNTDNSFTITLSCNPCFLNFDGQHVSYDRIIKGKLGLGKVTEVSGIQAKKLFFWVSVDGIDVNEKKGTLEFHVGPLSQELPAKDFEDVKSCKAKAVVTLGVDYS